MGTMVQLCLILVELVVGIYCENSLSLVEIYKSSQEFINLQYYNETLFIGSKNEILVLNDSLDIQSKVPTCAKRNVDCKNSNKVLLVNHLKQQLLVCGMGNEGVCETRSLQNLSEIYRSSASIPRDNVYLQVSNNTNRPAKALVTRDGEYMMAITFGSGIVDFTPTSYKYPLIIMTDSFVTVPKTKTLSLNIDSNIGVANYIIYYRGQFHVNGSSYFITNQQNFVGGNQYLSKIVKICETMENYVDIVITCKDYNLVQDVVLVKTENPSKTRVVFTFSKGDNPEEPSKQSALCVADLNDIDQALFSAKVKFAFLNNKTFETNEVGKRYLSNNKLQGNDQYIYATGNDTEIFKDCKNPISTYSNVIGDEQISLNLKNEFSSSWITTIHASRVGGNNVLLAGTSDGVLLMMNVNSDDSITLYNTKTVDVRKPVRAIYMKDEDHVYVMTSEKVFQYTSSDCNEYKTCSDVVEKQNPLCGWCVFKNRSTRNKEALCPRSDWLPALNRKCVTIKPNVTSIEIGENMSSPMEISTENLPGTTNAYRYLCQFEKDTFVIATNATRYGSTFYCTIPSVTSHMNATLRLLVDNGIAVFELASHPFLFYRCSFYKKCSECVNVCSWCDKSITCISRRSIECPEVVKQNFNNCPRLGSSTNVIPRNVPSKVLLKTENVNSNLTYYCVTNGSNVNFVAEVKAVDSITCNVTITSGEEAKNYYRISIKYGYLDNLVEMDDFNNNAVTVYSCSSLGPDCYHCGALKKSFNCVWCSEKCEFSTECRNGNRTCPYPSITKLIPDNGPNTGGTKVSLEGLNFGTEDLNIITAVKLSEESCTNLSHYYSNSNDFDKNVTNKIVCTADPLPPTSPYLTKPGPVTVALTVDSNKITITSSVVYNYKKPNITDVNPKKGPQAGGTRITLFGENLGVGNQHVKVLLNNNNCTEETVRPFIQSSSWDDRSRIPFYIECKTPGNAQTSNLSSITLFMDTDVAVRQQIIDYSYLLNPIIHRDKLNSTKGIVSGGIAITILGTFLDHANVATIKGKDEDGVELTSKCDIINSTMAVCKGPNATTSMVKKLSSDLEQTGNRRKRSTCDTYGCIRVEVQVHFDGVTEPFIIEFYQDPTINESNDVLLFGTRERELTIRGKNLNLVAKESDINITIGLGTCTVFKLESDYLTCIAPTDEPQKADVNSPYPEIKVRIGNIERRVGYVEYKKELELIAIIAGSVGGVLFALMVIGFSIGILKYRKIGKKAKQYEKNLSDMEMEIRKVAREEFLDMHTTMSSVNRNLVEQGFPYHSYQQYACNVMFSVDYLWTEPVVSNGKMTDDERIKANKGMEMMESLFYNKFFIVSVISTMEKQKRFFIREKANLAGNLCAVLMGKMDYLEEILKMLLSNLVQDTPSKKQKSLFRRCESITEKLLSNWLSLCLYPHIRANSGSPLYLLYIATQKTMESGPIDAILGDAKYTLYEEKLLKKWSSTEEGKQDLKFEAKTLTLNVVVDNGETIYKCKVLDCDTISQVKSKCMAQIYVNYPASQLNVDPHDLDLEWHEGFGGALRLKDEDNTSKRDGPLVRLNTLAHYNVKDESNMALVDPHGAENKEEDYVNLTNVNADNACDGSLDSSEPLHPRDGQNPGALQHWHLVKKEEETSKQGKSAIAELYLNRLFTTKQCLMEYISTLFNIVLEKDRCPPPTKCLFDFLDDLGDRHKIDADTLYTWKSHSYAIRVWASLIKMPSLLFDVNIPNYVEENLDVISQVFIESFSLSSQKFTKDSPSQKLIFHNEMILYRDRVKEFYKNVKVDSQTQDEYRQYMTEVNKQQQQTNFNKVSALYRLYKQLKPYFEEILEDLATCKETSNLRLDKKLEEVMDIMDDEDK